MPNFCAIALFFLFTGTLHAQTAVLTGNVTDSSGAAVSRARVTVHNALTGFERHTESRDDGSFTVTNIPFQTYEIIVEHGSFLAHTQTRSLRTNIPHTVDIALALKTEFKSLTVSAVDRSLLVDPEETGTRTQMNQSDIEKMPVQMGNRGVEAILVTFPGFQQNANGAIHPRGAHNQMTYVIDGMPISDQLTGAFANAVDPNIVQTIELYMGNVPVEYGNKVSGVANITTKSGVGVGKLFSGSVSVSAARYNTFGTVAQVAGERGKFGYSALVNAVGTDRYLDSVSLDNLHNHGRSARGFARLDYSATARDILRLNFLMGSSPFELANLRSQQRRGMDQRQLLRDFSAALGWVHTIDARSTFDANLSWRSATGRLFSSAGDFPVSASQARRLDTFTWANRYNRLAGRHNIRAGVDYQRFAPREAFALAITGANFNQPEAANYNPALLPFDLTRSGQPFQFSDRAVGRLFSGYAQDSMQAGRVHLTFGLRYDNYRLLSHGIQWQPRVGVAYSLKETGTVLRASYNRLYQTPVNENLLLSNSPQAAVITPPAVRQALGAAFAPIRPERQNFYETGIQQAVGKRISLSVAYYHKDSWDQADNNNFLDTGIIFPIALAKIRVNSVESRLAVPAWRGVSGTLSFTHSRAISTPPFTGGLFIGNDAIAALTSGPFVIDHDQKFALHGILNYSHRKGIYTTLSLRHDSGLVANPSDPAQVARDPDYADLLPLVNLTGNPPRIRPRNIADLLIGFTRTREGRARYDAALQLSNLFNTTALYNFQSIFVGTRVVQPFTAGARVRWYF